MNPKMLVTTVSLSLVSMVCLFAQTKPLEQMSDMQRATFFREQKVEVLKGLPGVLVYAFWNSPSPSEENDRLQSAVELRLRNNGIPVFASSDEYKRSPGRPMLACMVSYYTIGSVLVARTDVQLVEEVKSIRTSMVHVFPTWENTVPRQKIPDAVSFEQGREWLFEAVDEFCNAYRAANPKLAP